MNRRPLRPELAAPPGSSLPSEPAEVRMAAQAGGCEGSLLYSLLYLVGRDPGLQSNVFICCCSLAWLAC